MAKDPPARPAVYEARAAEVLMHLVESDDEQAAVAAATTTAAGLASLAVARRLEDVAEELHRTTRMLGSGR